MAWMWHHETLYQLKTGFLSKFLNGAATWLMIIKASLILALDNRLLPSKRWDLHRPQWIKTTSYATHQFQSKNLKMMNSLLIIAIVLEHTTQKYMCLHLLFPWFMPPFYPPLIILQYFAHLTTTSWLLLTIVSFDPTLYSS